MNADVENLVLEQFSPIRGEIGALRQEMGEVRQRVLSMERHLADIQRLLANQQGDVVLVHRCLDRVGERLQRIERRLELADTAV
ncbi:MAG: hypothetical protein OYH76_14100 [Defluviicoccus sp.]|nr:hypothetical protein [Defluviicoccus sp.]MDE0277022.1 hypothetical protein [Defluviicoccus sp.]